MARYWIDNQPEEIPFEDLGETAKRIVQNAKNLLMTRRGEVPYDRSRGFDPALFDLPVPQLQERLMPEVDRVLIWEPRAEAVEAQAERTDTGETVIRVLIEVQE